MRVADAETIKNCVRPAIESFEAGGEIVRINDKVTCIDVKRKELPLVRGFDFGPQALLI